jgi:hypothetical protein
LTHWRIDQEVGPNSFASSSKPRPARCSATIWRRNSGVYLGCDLAISIPLFCEHDVSTKPGQVHNEPALVVIYRAKTGKTLPPRVASAPTG